MRISTDRGMVRLDLCVDYNRGRVSVYSTERWGGGSESMDQKGRRELGVGGSKFMDQKGCREVGVGLCITTRMGREVRWVGGGGGGVAVSLAQRGRRQNVGLYF